MEQDSDALNPALVPDRPSARVAVGALGNTPNEVTAADFGLFRDILNSHYYPAIVEPTDPAAGMTQPRLSAVRLRLTTIGLVRFGAAARVDPGDLGTYHVNVPLKGAVVSQCGEQVTTAHPARAAVFSPGQHTVLPRWGADAAQLCIKFDRHAVERVAADLLRRPDQRPIRFRIDFPLTGTAAMRWLSILSTILQFADGSTNPADSYVVESLELGLISGLLVAQQHSLSDELAAASAGRATRRVLDPVIDAMHSAPDRAYSLADFARMAGLSARAVQYAFSEHYGTSPMRYLRKVRLDRAREDLRLGNGTVSDIASYWGFSNLGRFAREYRAQFGEFPSETRRSRLSRGMLGNPVNVVR